MTRAVDRRWTQLEHAVELPPITQGTDPVLELTLGERYVGWSLLGQSHELAGPPLDLTGATVTLTALLVPEPPALLEDADWSDSPIAGLTSSFDVEGSIDSDPATGLVLFAITAAQLDFAGRLVLEPRVTTAGGGQKVPRLLKVTVLPRAS